MIQKIFMIYILESQNVLNSQSQFDKATANPSTIQIIIIPATFHWKSIGVCVSYGLAAVYYFMRHQEFISGFWNGRESGHSHGDSLGLTTPKSHSKAQNERNGLPHSFQPLVEWCFDCVWAVSIAIAKQLW